MTASQIPTSPPLSRANEVRTQFPSLLFPAAWPPPSRASEPPWFGDLNLDQVVAEVTAGRDEYALKPLFHPLPHDAETVRFRQEVMRELEDPTLLASCTRFAQQMRRVRCALQQAEKFYYPRQGQRLRLDAAVRYCAAVRDLRDAMHEAGSPGLKALHSALGTYLDSTEFGALEAQACQLLERLDHVRYCLLIRDNRVTVRPADDQADYSPQIEQTFARFRQKQAEGHEFHFSHSLEMNHVEAQILDGVAQLNAELFAELEAFCERYASACAGPPSPAGEAVDFARYPFIDAGLAAIDRELQFYLAWLDYVAPLRQAGLRFCYPEFAVDERGLHGEGCFDIALASKLLTEHRTPVSNDFHLDDSERIIIVTGPNQSGKTTFARTIGQLHHLAGIGCCVPGERVRVMLCDRIQTHFERSESLATGHSKLEDDLIRLHETFASVSADSLIILNEIFDSTTYRDALQLSRKVLQQLAERQLLCVWVTFVDELAAESGVVSMAGSIIESDPARRSYRIERRPADGLAYALSLAEKYGLTYRTLLKRLPS